ncbi:MAG TPA: hypothetical protein DEP84_21590 [Chloroflexi bacterium]|nr:hypothetical protein [Chloroflexota bacterium]
MDRDDHDHDGLRVLAEIVEGHIPGWLLSLYPFGYKTATIASHFIGQKTTGAQEPPSAEGTAALREEIAPLREQVAALAVHLEGQSAVSLPDSGESNSQG